MESLLELLRKQVHYYRAILDITEQENRKFQYSKPLDEIVPLMKKKKILLSCIEELNKEIQPQKKEWKASPRPRPLEGPIDAEMKEIDELLRHILALDTMNQELLRRQMSVQS